MASFMAVLLLLTVAVFVGEAQGSKVLLVSMDGFRWDYLDKVSGLGNFSLLPRKGCYVDYVITTFATKTFPCHYSMVTGLYEESHGILSNYMFDSVRNATFTRRSKESFWWEGGEPIWVTAEKQGKRAGAFNWVGSESEIHGYRPTNYTAYNKYIPANERLDTVLGWLVEPNLEKEVVVLHFHEPDGTGHKAGPNSPETFAKVREMDDILGMILRKLDEKNLTDVVNVILTSDHGMAEIDLDMKLLDLWQYINKTTVKKVVDSGTVTAILPEEGREAEVMSAASRIPHVTSYRKQDIPDHFHYKNNPRVMPIIIISDEGWELTEDYSGTKAWAGKGDHGYSNELPSMRSIFFAWGPDFRKGVKKTSINLLDIYPLMCHLLNITAGPNNGSLNNVADFLLVNPIKPSSFSAAPTPSTIMVALMVVSVGFV